MRTPPISAGFTCTVGRSLVPKRFASAASSSFTWPSASGKAVSMRQSATPSASVLQLPELHGDFGKHHQALVRDQQLQEIRAGGGQRLLHHAREKIHHL